MVTLGFCRQNTGHRHKQPGVTLFSVYWQQGRKSQFRQLVYSTGALLMFGCATVKQLPSENHDKRIRSLVIHFTAIDYAQSVQALVGKDGLSSHYLLPESRDPSYPHSNLTPLQLVQEEDRAWHAGKSYWQGRTNLNDSSIGIELVNVPDCQPELLAAPQGPEYSSPSCVFPAYDGDQIGQLIELASDILARNPDIHPTAVVGHSDIAFNRKRDPGPRFPWYQLYQAGIGAWYDDGTLARYRQLFSEQRPSVYLFQKALRSYGYGVNESGVLDKQTKNALSAFQLHFLPAGVTGLPDSETAAILFALLDRYFPDQLAECVNDFEQQVELISTQQPPDKRGQLDQTLIGQTPDSTNQPYLRQTFKAYAGAGWISLAASQDSFADIRINGQKINIAQPLEAGRNYTYSLARRTRNGLNTLSLENLQPDNVSLDVRIPYPVLTGGHAETTIEDDKVDKLIQQRIAAGLPEAVLLVFKDGKIIKHTTYGTARKSASTSQTSIPPESPKSGHSRGLLAMFTQRMTGLTANEYCENLQYAPLGLDSHGAAAQVAAFDVSDDFNNSLCYGKNLPFSAPDLTLAEDKSATLHSDALELATLLQSLLNGGGYNDRRLIGTDTVQGLLSPGSKQGGSASGLQQANKLRHYFGPYASNSAYGVAGQPGLIALVEPELEMGIVFLTREPNTSDYTDEPASTQASAEPEFFAEVVSLIYESGLNAP
ncbi:hypothetical protein DXV75_06495 [Alteromonas aestuariivivens]|uniref:N-acetylmuramoyl-L-alanine amidase n=1 Tax=Alteromonas aestuariivivens TaxID=1938339 RepID=A0A3D8MA19_9ALTE|nr:N-acetylmuramoyl-L-alanine amidase [Alteromonas aestuariivivens]RDV26635.1 hypothetical protein DXV75_06495 [Alteromonas aestuariivivens]